MSRLISFIKMYALIHTPFTLCRWLMCIINIQHNPLFHTLNHLVLQTLSRIACTLVLLVIFLLWACRFGAWTCTGNFLLNDISKNFVNCFFPPLSSYSVALSVFTACKLGLMGKRIIHILIIIFFKYLGKYIIIIMVIIFIVIFLCS